jgi:hypothetical protein
LCWHNCLLRSAYCRLITTLSEVATWIWKSRFRTGGDYKPDEKFIDILEKSRRRVRKSDHGK